MTILTRWVRGWLAPSPEQDWVLEAEWARIQQRPLRAKVLLYFIIVTLCVLIAWASFANIDEISRGEGRVVPSSSLQILQSFDGGIVQDILVREGNKVAAGQVIMNMDSTRYMSSLQENNSRFNAVAAKVERLTAQLHNKSLNFPEEIVNDAPDIVANERALYQSSVQEMQEVAQRFSSRITQRREDLASFQSEMRQYQETLTLARKELAVTRPLLSSGAVSEIDLLRLERQVIENEGAIERTRSAIARSVAAIEEEQNNLKETQLKMVNLWNAELNDAVEKMASLKESQVGFQDIVQQSSIRSPVAGTVQRLLFNTIGGVITPGSQVAEIIPEGDTLIVEARLAPKDIAFIQLGQPATLRFSAYDFAIYGGIEATVKHISADTVTDEREQTYYVVRLATAADKTPKFQILPGMMVQADIITGKRTVMQYLLNPFLRASSSALRER